MSNPFNKQSGESGEQAARKVFGQPSPKGNSPADVEADNDDASEVPKGGKFHSMRIESAENGFSVTTTHKTPRPPSKDGKDTMPSYDGDNMDRKEKTSVFNHKRQLVDHILKNC